MGELMAVLLIGATAVILIMAITAYLVAAWPLLAALAGMWVAFLIGRHIYRQRMNQTLLTMQQRGALVDRANRTLEAYNEGRTDDWLYGKYKPVPLPGEDDCGCGGLCS